MADNVPVTDANGLPRPVATDEIGGVSFQRVKLIHGADGVNAGDVATTNPLPVLVYAQTDDGQPSRLVTDEHGHLEVSLHGPRLPFGSIHTESLTPIIQIDGVYGLNEQLVSQYPSGSGSCSASQAMMTVSTGTTIYSAGTLQSRRRLRYRPGQGSICRFTMLCQSPVASSYQIGGLGHAEDGFYFGYVGTTFGILHVAHGAREVQTLTVSTKSSTAENVTVTLNGVAFSVAVTNGASTLTTAYEISRGTYTGWFAEAIGSTVVFIAAAAGDKASTFSLSGSTVVCTFAETRAGAASTDTFIPQSSWNVDKLDGTGVSGVTLDPTKGNVYQIELEYLGFGCVVFRVETAPDGNNHIMTACHVIDYPNQNTRPSISNPSMPFTLAAYSAGSTTDITTKCGSVAGFIGGMKYMNGPRVAHYNSAASVGSANYTAILTVRNTRYFKGKANQSVINLISLTAAAKHTQPVTLFVIRNGVLAGSPNFISDGVNSTAYSDIAATTVTPSSDEAILLALPLAETGQAQLNFEDDLTLQPGEWLTIAAKSVSGSASYVSASINTREDH